MTETSEPIRVRATALRALRDRVLRWLYVRISANDDAFELVLRTLPEALAARGTSWWHFGSNKNDLSRVGGGYGTSYSLGLRRGQRDMEVVHLREGHWTIAWGGEWRYRIVPLDQQVDEKREPLSEWAVAHDALTP